MRRPNLRLPRVAGELYRSAAALRVFVLATAKIPERAIVDLVMLPREEVVKLLEEGLPMIRG